MGYGVFSIATEKGHIQVVLKNSQLWREASTDRARLAQMERGQAQMDTKCAEQAVVCRPYRDKNGFIGGRELEVATNGSSGHLEGIGKP